MEALLEVKQLTKNYQNFTLDRVDLTIPKGSIVGFIGENGAGKTTTIKAIIGAIHKDAGEVYLLGKPFDRGKKDLMQEVAVVMEGSFFNDELTPNQIAHILRGLYRKWKDETFHRYLQKFKLPPSKKVKEFSKGMRMKLSIAIALSHDAKLLILDEPTSGLDPIVRSEILEIFQDFIIDENRSILLSSHITTDLEKIADYIAFIHNGKILLNETKDDLLYNYGLVKCSFDQFKKLDGSKVIGYKKGSFSIEALVRDKKVVQRNHPDLLVENPTIEDIMLYFVRGDHS